MTTKNLVQEAIRRKNGPREQSITGSSFLHEAIEYEDVFLLMGIEVPEERNSLYIRIENFCIFVGTFKQFNLDSDMLYQKIKSIKGKRPETIGIRLPYSTRIIIVNSFSPLCSI